MALKDKKFTVGETECYAVQWPAKKALLLKFKLIAAFGETLGNAAKEIPMGVGIPTDLQMEIVGKLMGQLFNNTSPEQALDLLIEVISGVNYGGNVISSNNFDELFYGDIMASYKVLYEVIQLNYSEFFANEAKK